MASVSSGQQPAQGQGNCVLRVEDNDTLGDLESQDQTNTSPNTATSIVDTYATTTTLPAPNAADRPPSSNEPTTPVSILQARREQIQDILHGRASSLHLQESNLKAKSQKNREDRIALARQLNEIHASHAAREKRRLEVEQELGRIQKQSMVNDVMFRKQVYCKETVGDTVMLISSSCVVHSIDIESSYVTSCPHITWCYDVTGAG